ncbi:MAG: ADP-ribosylglycohydrolase family protein [Luteolibacter sp.]
MATSSDILFTSLIGDALALGPHWIYHQKELRQRFGHIMGYFPPATAYHAGRKAGDFTHYGDQTLLLLRSIEERGRFDLPHFAGVWRAFWENPETVSYRDGATKTTLAHLQSGMPLESAASASADLAGAARIAPLFLLKWENDACLFSAARALTAFTHSDPAVIEAAEFFARLALDVRRGASIPQALEKTAKLPHLKAIPIEWIAAARLSNESPCSDAEALNDHGLTCHIPDAFTGVCHLLLRHPDAPAIALTENINAGGDSAARGMILGLVYGAAFPVSALPAAWLRELNAREEISALIGKLT